MINAKSLLDGLMGQMNAATGGQGAGGLAGKAKGAWDNQSSLGKGAIAGGLLGLLLTGSGKKMLKTGAKVGGAALIGGLAYKAYEDWKAGKSVQAGAEAGPVALPRPEGTVFLPSDPVAADDLATRLLQAMVAAAKADGHVTTRERARISEQLEQVGLGAEAETLIRAELDAPLDAGRIAGLARSEEEAAEIYAASLLVVDPEAPAEKGYLAMLAARLGLHDDLVAHLHARAAQLA
ncbi:tellurite resistance TerB family protein [Pseudotabrizicola sp. L79]|uniref:tellurite resistance TerB family protein n=1 Tax=Pseudotabrizicola sp. L79 TaxID=3118402 RepID=UPI002F945D72